MIAPEVTLPLVRSYLKGLRRRNQSVIDYKLCPYNGAATLIRAEDGKGKNFPRIDPADPTSGFSELCSKVEVAFVPGTHFNLMLPPYVEKVAEAIRRSLHDIEARETEKSVTAAYAAV